jgi:hypothetical protein
VTLTVEAVKTAISSGLFDSELGAISTELEARREVVRASKKPTDFGVGDKVRFNNNCGTRYLVGHTARVVGMKRTKIVVKLDTPMGRFVRVDASGKAESASITVPISLVDPA